jgi:SAM-dependent methyltransferase
LGAAVAAVRVCRYRGEQPIAESLDAAFSMFGLIFFPDRPKGHRELYRTVKRGGLLSFQIGNRWSALN